MSRVIILDTGPLGLLTNPKLQDTNNPWHERLRRRAERKTHL
jgi:hypothetical protein